MKLQKKWPEMTRGAVKAEDPVNVTPLRRRPIVRTPGEAWDQPSSPII